MVCVRIVLKCVIRSFQKKHWNHESIHSMITPKTLHMVENDLKINDIEAPVPEICPVTGLDVLRYPEWCSDAAQPSYILRITVISRKIIHIQASGSLSPDSLQQSFERVERILGRLNPAPKPFVIIEDMSRIGGIPIQVRKQFVDNIRSVPHMAALIFHSVSSFQRFMIRLGKLVQLLPFSLLVVQDYSQAVQKALEALGESSVSALSVDPELLLPDIQVNPRIFPDETGILTGTEWLFQDESLNMKFHVIDGRILHSVSTGFIEEHHIPGLEAIWTGQRTMPSLGLRHH